ncbi:Alpha/beta hydrolase fold-1 - like 10 [Theobroma cacao]|nr:Alpha/beta hydrolase fold-1 - like 10 [Theobroma cacao]
MSFLKIYKFLLHGVLKLAGISPRTIEIEPGTIMNFWVPTETINNTNTKRKKPAVVFLHGFAFDGILTWQCQALALAKEYSVYVPDFLFFGGSITDKTERSVEFQAECMAKGLRKLGVEKCTLVGFSYGGMVGFKMAEMYPDLVESMVVTCSVMALTESISNAGLERIGFPSWADYLLPVSVRGVETLLQVATYSFPKLPNWIYKDILEGIFIYRKEKVELLEALVISDKEFTIPCYQQNIYLLWGQNDKIFDLGTARNLKQQIGEKASLEHIEKSGHIVQLERPFVYSSHLKKIFASLWSKEKSHAPDAFPQPKKK